MRAGLASPGYSAPGWIGDAVTPSFNPGTFGVAAGIVANPAPANYQLDQAAAAALAPAADPADLLAADLDTGAGVESSGVRARFGGRLTYAANHIDGANSLGFWDALDYIGIDAYEPLSWSDPNPSTETLAASWCGVNTTVSTRPATFASTCSVPRTVAPGATPVRAVISGPVAAEAAGTTSPTAVAATARTAAALQAPRLCRRSGVIAISSRGKGERRRWPSMPWRGGARVSRKTPGRHRAGFTRIGRRY